MLFSRRKLRHVTWTRKGAPPATGSLGDTGSGWWTLARLRSPSDSAAWCGGPLPPSNPGRRPAARLCGRGLADELQLQIDVRPVPLWHRRRGAPQGRRPSPPGNPSASLHPPRPTPGIACSVRVIGREHTAQRFKAMGVVMESFQYRKVGEDHLPAVTEEESDAGASRYRVRSLPPDRQRKGLFPYDPHPGGGESVHSPRK